VLGVLDFCAYLLYNRYNKNKHKIMKFGKFLAVVLALFVSVAACAVAFADDIEKEKAAQEVCGFEFMDEDEAFYDAEVVAIRRKLKIEPGEVFRVKVFIKNTGNMPWFSAESECYGPEMHFGNR
jgi:hypothetical protein